MVYPYLTLAGFRSLPRFPTPPSKQIVMENMPNDLRANGRNYYTEISFVDYRTGILGINNYVNSALDQTNSFLSSSQTSGGVLGTISGAINSYVASAAGTFSSLASIRLPIPNTINDTTVLNWNVRSATSDLASIIGGVGGMTTQNIMTAGSIAIGAVGAATGKTLNPLLYAAFNRAEFRQFSFDWILAPRTRRESETLKRIVRSFKAAALPSGSGLIQDYPLLVIVRMHPNDLDGLATFWPMAITSVNINYTANPGGPSFFEDTGSPTIATLRVNLMELKMRLREEVGIGIG